MRFSLLSLAILAAVTGKLHYKTLPRGPAKPEQCQDFYESVCQDWVQRHDIPSGNMRWSKFLEAKRQIAGKVADALSMSAELLHHERQARIFFDSCNDFAGTPTVFLLKIMREMSSMMEELTSWPVLDDSNGALYDFNQLVKAVSRHYETWPFFSVSSNIDMEQNNNTLLLIDSPEPFYGDLVRENSTQYELEFSLYAKVWALATGKSLDDAALAKEVEEVAQFEKDIAEIVSPMVKMATKAMAMQNKFKISQLSDLLPLIDWSDVLLSFSPTYLHDYIRGDPDIIVADPEYLRQLGRVLAKYKARTLFNYAYWQHLVDKLIIPMNKLLDGPSTEICVDFTSFALPEAVDSFFLNRVQPQADSDDSVEALFGDIQAAMLAMLDEVHWLDVLSRERARQKARLVR